MENCQSLELPCPVKTMLNEKQDIPEAVNNLADAFVDMEAQYQTNKAEILICLGSEFARLKVQDRPFSIGFKMNISHKEISAAIQLSKIVGIEKLYNFGWDKLYYLYVNAKGVSLKDLSLDSILKNYGEISIKTIEASLIRKVLAKAKTFEPMKVIEFMKHGLRLEHISDEQNMKRICESNNITITIYSISKRLNIDKLKTIKKHIKSARDSQILEKLSAILNEILKQEGRFKHLDEVVLIDICQKCEKILDKLIHANKGEYSRGIWTDEDAAGVDEHYNKFFGNK